jgi:hypothetical protein
VKYWELRSDEKQTSVLGAYDDFVRLELVRLEPEIFRAMALAVDEGSV